MTQHANAVVGHGIDVVSLTSFRVLTEDQVRLHLDRIFLAEELNVVGESANGIERLASRFAVKEAVLKALGVGWGDGVSFKDVEVVTVSSGALSVVLRGSIAQLADSKGVSSWMISTSHDGDMVVASVICLSDR